MTRQTKTAQRLVAATSNSAYTEQIASTQHKDESKVCHYSDCKNGKGENLAESSDTAVELELSD